ncbi:L-2-amino-thiazoline-4-carboxylic acid hydrolase [Clostridium estertheticum]|uniref:L-2-amino-thiazoline-4-carboxylic acid hydrolase n=1 Tax=Clostridium estertheticum TaxID=238834 RepID=UPI001C6E0A15|nr:L-2-amino-thiazoline-4-carboxylic acid hydrolase [Clostridium estertheticum]MBW9154715.1 L-2-amino-thiazoline-4-carboxylic acid hydrolase [Clostridium estertheticum]WLC85214.1 L-2-amino-thiazoline-4-carboxylic acid hydrolase [Clostridium estertheticum]
MKKFLINEFGEKQGERIYQKQQERFYILVKQSNRNSKSQLKTLKHRILPRIALYQILQEIPMDKERALQIVSKYFLQEVKKIVNLAHKIEKLPCFYQIFCIIFSKALKADNWELSIKQSDNEAMIFTIKKCLWYDTCVENNCPEMCPMFCKSDYMIYGSMKKITFKRTQTLGMCGEYCDFKFINNKIK